MRAFDLGRDDLDLALFSFNTVNLLVTLDDALACLRCARRHLAPAGRLNIDTFLPSPARLLAEQLQIDYTLPDDTQITIRADRTYDPAQQLRTLDLVTRSSDGSPPGTDRLEVHVYYPSELVLLLTQAGFDVVATYGGYDQRRLDARSSRLIIDTFLPSPQRLLPEELQIDYTLPDGDHVTIRARRSYDAARQVRALPRARADRPPAPPPRRPVAGR